MATKNKKKSATATQASKNLQQLFSANETLEDMDLEVNDLLSEDLDLGDQFFTIFDEEDSLKAKEEVEKAKAGGMEFVDINKLVPSDLNKFNMRIDDSYNAIKESMRKEGFLEFLAITGEKREDGKVTIISGHRRTKIAKSLGLKEIPIIYVSCDDDVDRLRKIVKSNFHRPDSVYDVLHNYQAFDELCETEKFSKEEIDMFPSRRHFISHELGIAETKIRNLIFLLPYSEVIWELIDLDVIKTSVIRRYHLKRKEYGNYEEIIKELEETKELRDSSLALEERQKLAKTILEKLKAIDSKKEKRKQKVHKELAKLDKSINRILTMKDYEVPKTETEKRYVQEEIEKIEDKLTKLKELIESRE